MPVRHRSKNGRDEMTVFPVTQHKTKKEKYSIIIGGSSNRPIHPLIHHLPHPMTQTLPPLGRLATIPQTNYCSIYCYAKYVDLDIYATERSHTQKTTGFGNWYIYNLFIVESSKVNLQIDSTFSTSEISVWISRTTRKQVQIHSACQILQLEI